jgi:hypothetical protein
MPSGAARRYGVAGAREGMVVIDPVRPSVYLWVPSWGRLVELDRRTGRGRARFSPFVRSKRLSSERSAADGGVWTRSSGQRWAIAVF